MLVGILADTHGLLDARVVPALRSAACTRILHAGDIADAFPSRLSLPALLAALEEVAPVSAVRGNTDDKVAAGHGLPATLVHACGGVRFVMHHGDLIDDCGQATGGAQGVTSSFQGTHIRLVLCGTAAASTF